MEKENLRLDPQTPRSKYLEKLLLFMIMKIKQDPQFLSTDFSHLKNADEKSILSTLKREDLQDLLSIIKSRIHTLKADSP